MRRRFDHRVLVGPATFLLLSASALAQKYPAFPAAGAKKVQDTEAVTVWDVTWTRGQSTGMCEHRLDQVSVTLSGGAVKVTRPDGTWSVEQRRFGSVRFESKGTVEAEEGLSDQPGRAMIFQLKDFLPTKAPTVEGIPGQFPRIGATELFETERIKVWDATWKDRTPLHLHYTQTAAVFLDGGTIRSYSSEGERTFSREPGFVLIGAPVKVPHSEQQTEGSPRAIFIEFK
jgi:hypothetical protein